MRRFTGRRRLLLVGALGASVLVGTGTALAVSSGGNGASPFWNDVARRLGVTPTRLQSAMQQAMADRLNELVKQGTLTRAQADAILKRMRQHPDGPFVGPGWDRDRLGPPMFPHRGLRGHAFGGPGFMHPGPFGGSLQAAATYLGVPVGALLTDLRSGKTLASVAQTKGKSVAGLEQAMIHAATTQLDAAVKAGRLTTTQRATIAKMLSARLKDFVERGFQWHHDGDDGGPARGMGMAWGAAPAVGSGV